MPTATTMRALLVLALLGAALAPAQQAPPGETPPTDSAPPPGETAGAETAATTEETPAEPPKLVVAEPVIDAGTTVRGESVEVEFVLANQGTGELVIKNAQPSCGCTVASFDRRIAPGATGKVRAVVDTTSFAGPIAKHVTVLSNDPVSPRLELTIKVDVRAHVLAVPAYARFVHTQTLPPPSTGVTLYSPDLPEFRVLSAESGFEHATASVREATAEERVADFAGPQWRVEVRLDETTPVGPLRDFVVVRTNHPRQSELQLPLSGIVRPVLHLTPSAANFGELSLAGQAREMSLTLINFGAEPVEVRAVSTDVEGAVARVEEVEKGKRWKIVVELGPELPKGKLEGTLRVETSSPALPRLEAPLTARIS